MLVPIQICKERTNTVSRIGDAGSVVSERSNTVRRVGAAGGVALERIGTAGRVVNAGVVNERVITQNRVGIGKAALLTSRSRLRHKRRACEGKGDKETALQKQSANQISEGWNCVCELNRIVHKSSSFLDGLTCNFRSERA